MMVWIDTLLQSIALPEAGLVAVFIISLLSSTLLPMGSEAVLLAYVNAHPDMFWISIVLATLGNTLGGIITFCMGRGAEALYERFAHPGAASRWMVKARRWLDRWGAPVLLLSWLPVIGDPLCAVAGWLHLPFWRSATCIAIGKALRYLVLALSLTWFFPAS